MTVEAVLAWSLCRSLVISAIAFPLACLVCRLLRSRQLSLGQRGILTVAALTPLFVPDLLTGFTYRLTSMRLLHSTVATELLYAGLLLFRVSALQTAVLLLLPPSPVSREARHCWRLLDDGSFGHRFESFRLFLAGSGRQAVLTWLAGVLICFQEFEMAALLQIESYPVAWTVWLFDAQAAGETLSVSLGYIGRATLLQAALLVPLLVLLPRSAERSEGVANAGHRSGQSTGRPVGRVTGLFSTLFILAGLHILLLWPVTSNANAAAKGLRGLYDLGVLPTRMAEVATSLIPIVVSAVFAMLIVRPLRKSSLRWLTMILLLPGLCGSLFISLTVQRLFQFSILNPFYDTWIPMVLGLTLFALPRAWLLLRLLDITFPRTALHSGALLMSANDRSMVAVGRSLLWRLGDLRWLLATALLTHWCFWDVTVVFTLRPVRFEHVVTRLYNEMHYGRSEFLVAGTLLTLVIPLTMFVTVGFIWKYLPKWGMPAHG